MIKEQPESSRRKERSKMSQLTIASISPRSIGPRLIKYWNEARPIIEDTAPALKKFGTDCFRYAQNLFFGSKPYVTLNIANIPSKIEGEEVSIRYSDLFLELLGKDALEGIARNPAKLRQGTDGWSAR